MEHGAERPHDDAVEDPGPDRDLAALQSLESELASLEGELDRVEGSDPAAGGSEGSTPGEPPV